VRAFPLSRLALLDSSPTLSNRPPLRTPPSCNFPGKSPFTPLFLEVSLNSTLSPRLPVSFLFLTQISVRCEPFLLFIREGRRQLLHPSFPKPFLRRCSSEPFPSFFLRRLNSRVRPCLSSSPYPPPPPEPFLVAPHSTPLFLISSSAHAPQHFQWIINLSHHFPLSPRTPVDEIVPLRLSPPVIVVFTPPSFMS